MKKRILKILLGALIGGAIGYAYYAFIGCKSGKCPISSNWTISTLWGMILGAFGFNDFSFKKKKSEN